MRATRRSGSRQRPRTVVAVLAAVLFLVQSLVAGVGPVRGGDDGDLDRLLAVVCSHDGSTTVAPDAPSRDRHDGSDLCCVLGCAMGGGLGLATLPEPPTLGRTSDSATHRIGARLDHRGPVHRPPHVFGARAPPALSI
ncbi:DUF2946 domain-containing protein [Siculibacillus lacustris]|uniref:DUF2946 domain-containing protein n=1 Tax=Siculibacillus lacustris TaxID=1549641 RepID=A0A4V2KTE9_9HYPH|nr:DUF2946 family protein [Siculibacillus lacustris]TBW36978.1 DUF2946 domain-containing protein [Siculibacillus lacustris]